MVSDSLKDSAESQHGIVRDARIIPLYGSKEMQVRPIAKFLDNSYRRKPFIGDDDALPYIVIHYE